MNFFSILLENKIMNYLGVFWNLLCVFVRAELMWRLRSSERGDAKSQNKWWDTIETRQKVALKAG